MEIPNTTADQPYIEFRFDKKGNIKLSATSAWWGGRNAGFYSSDGTEGNTCLPKNLESYIGSFKNRKIKEIKKEIEMLQKKLEKYKK